MRILIIAIIAAVSTFADDKPPAKPTITPEHQAEYYRSQLVLKTATEDAQAAVGDMVKDCGEKYGPAQDPNNPKKLACVARPESEKK